MQPDIKTVEDYLKNLPHDRFEALTKLRNVILKNLPKRFVEEMNYGMIGYVVPHSIYPAGYHCDPKLPLPFMNLASHKNFIAFYHMGIYASPDLLEWFMEEYPKYSQAKLDMGKSCIRFKKIDQIPFELIGKLVSRMTAKEWIDVYEKNMKK